MCNVAMLQMAQVAIGAYGQAQHARAVNRNALDAEAAALAGLQEQTAQAYEHGTDQMVERSRQAMRDAGYLSAVFADVGLSGNSQERIAAVTEGDALRDLTTLERNQANRANQARAEAQGIAARTQSTISGVPRTSALGAGLQIAGYAVDDYDKRRKRDGEA